MAADSSNCFDRAGLARHARWYAIVFVFIVTQLIGWGCSTARRADTAEPATQKASDNVDGPLGSIFGPSPHKTGAQLWADNCTRCHYVRPPDYYSAAQWQLVMHHMRSRANLTGGEERKIVQFLKAGSGAEE